jgi:hypothetical protein
MTRWFYISFASLGGHLGSTVVQADDVDGAFAEATARGLNPGGEAQIVPVPTDRSEHPDLVAIRNRLVSKAELMQRGAISSGYHEDAEVVCEDCNTPSQVRFD